MLSRKVPWKTSSKVWCSNSLQAPCAGCQVVVGPRLDYVPALDGLRVVAVALVILFHAGVPFLPGANLGVDIFFVLSGYLIGRLLLAEFRAHAAIDLRRFYRRRLWRLMPPLLLLLALYAALAPLVWPDYCFHLRDGIELLLYVTDIALVFGDGPQYLTHAWSLSIEERFYLLLPVLLLFLLRVSGWHRLWLFFPFLCSFHCGDFIGCKGMLGGRFIIVLICA